jgi:hypothetical protein
MGGGITGYIVFYEKEKAVEEYLKKTKEGNHKELGKTQSETEQERRLNHKRRGKCRKEGWRRR